MFLFLLALTALSAGLMITGIVWTLMASGQMHRRDDADGRAEIIAERMADPDKGVNLAQRTAFKGKAVSVGGEVEISFADLKRLIRSGQWRAAMPIWLALGGMFGLLVFGSLALLLGVDNKLIGLIAVGVVLYALVRTLISFFQA